MLQVIDNQEVYVVDFDVMPLLPINATTPEDKPYARALTDAIHNGIITEPGKYGITVAVLNEDDMTYNIARIIE